MRVLFLLILRKAEGEASPFFRQYVKHHEYNDEHPNRIHLVGGE